MRRYQIQAAINAVHADAARAYEAAIARTGNAAERAYLDRRRAPLP